MGLREDNVGTLEDAAAKRKARLLELKNRKRKKDADDEDPVENNTTNDDGLPTPQVLFRNYRPSSEVLIEGVLEAAEPSDIEGMVQQQVTQAAHHAAAMQQVELSSLAPKKVTFDLKRCIEDKLEKLERATDRCIAELIRARLKEEAAEQQQQHDLLAAVNAGAMLDTSDQKEDED